MMPTQPNAIIIGSARASTTSLFYALSQHSDIFTLRDKEPNWYIFSGPRVNLLDNALPSRRARIEERAARSLEAYEALFDGYAAEKIILEASPIYLHLPGVEENIRANNPDVRLIVVRRDPADLLVSMYSAFLEREIDGFEDYFFGLDGDEDSSYLIEFVDLDRHIARYKAIFPDAQILEVAFGRIVREPERVIREMIGFLGLSPQPGVTMHKMNGSGSYSKGALGAILSALEKYKESLRRLLPNRFKMTVLPIIHKLRARVRTQNEGLDDRLRKRVQNELLAPHREGKK